MTRRLLQRHWENRLLHSIVYVEDNVLDTHPRYMLHTLHATQWVNIYIFFFTVLLLLSVSRSQVYYIPFPAILTTWNMSDMAFGDYTRQPRHILNNEYILVSHPMYITDHGNLLWVLCIFGMCVHEYANAYSHRYICVCVFNPGYLMYAIEFRLKCRNRLPISMGSTIPFSCICVPKQICIRALASESISKRTRNGLKMPPPTSVSCIDFTTLPFVISRYCTANNIC